MDKYLDLVLSLFNPLTPNQIQWLLGYTGKVGSLEQTMRLWQYIKEAKPQDRKYYLSTLQAVIQCNKQVYDAKQLFVRLEKCDKEKVGAIVEEVILFLDVVTSRLEYGWQNWDE
eukprot:TRINITY_DN5872_c0_g1_i2.p2 TRINITY_DN5872_c0_g1~~TRINITY_DN5872_c0_g1_i2.p2  ORF type:complete len:114 (-),score=26.52 TRINITY_DN5872_c0_g1_i2:9-350(-)